MGVSTGQGSDGKKRQGYHVREANMVPLAGLEPALLTEPHFECGASTNFTTGALSDAGD